MQPDPIDRFGMPDSAFEAARESHGDGSPVQRVGMDVPMREEVLSLAPSLLHSILIDWMWESPSELIPSNAQIASVIALLRERPDAEDEAVLDLIHSCEVYLQS
jgi:hypothetical protein